MRRELLVSGRERQNRSLPAKSSRTQHSADIPLRFNTSSTFFTSPRDRADEPWEGSRIVTAATPARGTPDRRARATTRDARSNGWHRTLRRVTRTHRRTDRRVREPAPI